MKKRSQVDKERSAADNRQRQGREYSGDRSRCRVTFRSPREAAPGATSVAVAGSFNAWSEDRHPMERSKDGDFTQEAEFEGGRECAFRFVIDGIRWENAWNADKYAWCHHAQCENSIIIT